MARFQLRRSFHSLMATKYDDDRFDRKRHGGSDRNPEQRSHQCAVDGPLDAARRAHFRSRYDEEPCDGRAQAARQASRKLMTETTEESSGDETAAGGDERPAHPDHGVPIEDSHSNNECHSDDCRKRAANNASGRRANP